MIESSDQYTEICKERFDDIQGKVDEIYTAIVGDIKNGRPGLQEMVRQNTTARKRGVAIMWAIVAGFIGQFAIWVRMTFFK